MNDTEQLFLVAAVWTLIAAGIARLIPNWPGRIAFVAIAVGLPFWELPYGYYNFRNLCEKQGRLQIFEKIAPQESVCIGDLDSGVYWGLIRAGFSRIELTGRSDDPNRDQRSGKVFRSKRQEVKSEYCYAGSTNNPLPWRVLRTDVLVVRARDEKIAVRQSQFQWDGMWWQAQASPILGRGGVCFEDPKLVTVALRGGTN